MDEFEENKAKNLYSAELVLRVETAVDEVVNMIERRVYPFDDSLIYFQPDPGAVQTLTALPDSATLWHFAKGRG
jgi:hypothetical protein